MTILYLMLAIAILLLVNIEIIIINKYSLKVLPSKLLAVLIVLLILFGLTLINGNIQTHKNNIIMQNYTIELSNKYLAGSLSALGQLSVNDRRISTAVSRLSSFDPSYNKIQIIKDGENTYKELFNDLNNAKSYIHIEDFIIENDSLGQEFINILINKSNQGVKVRLIIDGFGNKLNQSIRKKLRKNGVEISIINPKFKSLIMGNLNNRDHRKIFIIDGKIAYTGGINIGDEYLGKDPKEGYWRDTDIRVEGDGVKQLQCIFLSSWYLTTGIKLEGELYFPKTNNRHNQIAQIVSSYPDNEENQINYLYLNMISSAEESIYITTPYLVLNRNVYNALVLASLKGVNIKIIIPAKDSDNSSYPTTNYFARKLLDKGIGIYKYNKGYIHAKIIIIDGNLASIGTSNFNNRSLNLDYENTVLIYNKEVVNNLLNDFIQDIKDSKMTNNNDLDNKGFLDKVYEKLSLLFAPIE